MPKELTKYIPKIRQNTLDLYKKELNQWYISDLAMPNETPKLKLSKNSEISETPSEIRERQDMEKMLENEIQQEIEKYGKNSEVNTENIGEIIKKHNEDEELCNYEVNSFVSKNNDPQEISANVTNYNI